MISGDIEHQLKSEGYNVDGIVAISGRDQAYAVGFEASELPDEVLGYEIIDDPDL